MRVEVNGRLLDPQHVDPVEQGAREELAAGATFGLPPGLGQLLHVADRDVRWDVVQSLTSLGRRLLMVETSHRLLESLSVTVSKVVRHRAFTFTGDPIGCEAIRR